MPVDGSVGSRTTRTHTRPVLVWINLAEGMLTPRVHRSQNIVIRPRRAGTPTIPTHVPEPPKTTEGDEVERTFAVITLEAGCHYTTLTGSSL